MTEDTRWGNPEVKTFTKSYIREAKIGDAIVPVHMVIRPMTEELLTLLQEHEYDIASAFGHLGDPYGLTVGIDGPEPDDELVAKVLLLGFDPDTALGKPIFRFTANYDWAVAKSGGIHEERLAEMTVDFQPKPVSGNLPGSRELRRGDSGQDVRTLQVFFDLPDTGTYDSKLKKAVADFQVRYGLTSNGVADEEFWRALLPRKITWRRMGEAGRDIRLFQSALIVFGYQPAPLQNRFGIIMNKGVRALRDDRGLRGSTKLDRLAWEALFDLAWQGFTASPIVLQGA